MRQNPFMPGKIISPEIFAGREVEIRAIEQSLYNASRGNPNHFCLCGERGIGKSSLLLYVKALAEGHLQCSDGTRLQLLCVDVSLESKTNYMNIIRKIGAALVQEVKQRHQVKGALMNGWDFLKRWEVMGVKFNDKETRTLKPDEMLEDLIQTVCEALIVARKNASFEGILITIDEADKPGAEAQLGGFCKLFTEGLSRKGCNGVAIGLAGLPKLLGQLKASHESSPRIFRHMTMAPLGDADRKSVVESAIRRSNLDGFDKTAIDDGALNLIAALSEGYPHFIQEFGFWAFDADTDFKIDSNDVVGGAFRQDGAIFQLGQKYFHELYWEQINSSQYRLVLRTMADHLDGPVSKARLRTDTGLKDTTLTNALSALTARNIIKPVPGQKGVYKLPTRSFAVWIKALAADPAQATQTRHP